MSLFLRELASALRAVPETMRRVFHPGAAPAGDPAASRMRRNFLFHLHPIRVRPSTLSVSSTFALGLCTATLGFLLVVSGLLLMMVYAPDPARAYASMQDLAFALPGGGVVRSLHRLAAHGMVLCAGLHLLRVLFYSAYRRRELNWFFGLGLLLLTAALSFTGYLLPWDQRAFWAVNVSTSMLEHVPGGDGLRSMLLGGSEIGAESLLRFYALHVAILPALLVGLLALHLWRIRKDGGLAGRDNEEASIPAWPHLVLREALVFLAVVLALTILSALWDSPLGPPADPHRPDNPEKAPWYFVWIQEAVSHSALAGGVLLPGILLGLLALQPFLDRRDDGVGRPFSSPAGRRVFLGTLAIALAAGAALEAWFIATGGWPAHPDLVNPSTGMLALALVAWLVAGIWTGSVRLGMFGAIAVLLAAVLVFTFSGVCRGPDWRFFWPWEEWPGV
jgi:quinol-cytochrome oxidoreductase complex cytochrome b subunit